MLWENLIFLKTDELHVNQAMGRDEIRLVCADLVQIKFVSRKFQARGKVRVIPPFIRVFYPMSGHPDVNLCDLSIKVVVHGHTATGLVHRADESRAVDNSRPTRHAGSRRGAGR